MDTQVRKVCTKGNGDLYIKIEHLILPNFSV